MFRFYLAVLLLASAAACARPDEHAKAGRTGSQSSPAARGARDGAGAGADPVPVVTAPVEVKPMPVTLDSVGTVEAVATVEIRAQVNGQLRDIYFTQGQEVRKGQPLFSLDQRPFEAALRQAEALLARDTAQADNARAQRDRAQNLFNRGLIPRDQFETQTAGLAALEATVAADRAQVDQAKLNLQYARIVAPIDGRTGALMAHVGDLVRATDANPLVTINQLSPIDVTFSVPARFLDDIREHQKQAPLGVLATRASGTLPGAQEPAPPQGSDDDNGEGVGAAAPPVTGDRVAEGRVTFIDNAVDPATATIKLKGTFQNRERRLWPGLFVHVSLQLSSESDAIVVPAIAVQAAQQGQYVYVVKPDRTVAMRTVTVERQQGDQAVIARGLRRGEEVVTEGQLRLTPGVRVTARTDGRGSS